eukprot:XP_003725244.1 PREDICTED: gamma-aminobutyric acid type B receptor subunit 1 [Strongylocentrotus purpuratus]
MTAQIFGASLEQTIALMVDVRECFIFFYHLAGNSNNSDWTIFHPCRVQGSLDFCFCYFLNSISKQVDGNRVTSRYFDCCLLRSFMKMWSVVSTLCLLLSVVVPGALGVSPTTVSVDTYLKGCCGTESQSVDCVELLKKDFSDEFGATGNSSDLRNIFVGGLFPLTGSPVSANGKLDLEAACMALNHVNEQQVLEGYRLVMYFNDTQCDTGVGVDALYDQLYRKPTMSMLLGCSCSDVSKRVGQILPYWNVVMVSYGSTSVALTDQEYYPTFFRTVTPDSSHNAARASFIEYFKWNMVASLSQEEELFSLAQTKMSKYFESDTNITFSAVLSFVDDPGPQIQQLEEKDARIIIGSFQEDAARAVFCEAYKRGLYGAKYVWLLVGWYMRDWWLVEDDRIDCTPEELTEAVEGYFAVDSMDTNVDDRMSVSGLAEALPTEPTHLLIERDKDDDMTIV